MRSLVWEGRWEGRWDGSEATEAALKLLKIKTLKFVVAACRSCGARPVTQLYCCTIVSSLGCGCSLSAFLGEQQAQSSVDSDADCTDLKNNSLTEVDSRGPTVYDTS